MTSTRRPAPVRRCKAGGVSKGRRPLQRRLVASAAAALLAALLAAGGLAGAAGGGSPTHLVTTTPPGTKSVSKVVWAVNATIITLDPIFTFTYPENTAVSLMCQSLLEQAPTGVIEPGLATLSTPKPTTMVLSLHAGEKFWDGHPVTSADVVYSLDRAANPKLGGYFTTVFQEVKSIAATGPKTITITLKQATSWLEDELSGMPGVVIEKAFAEKEGKNYGTPAGGIMCTGAYEYKSWSPGVGVVAVANPHPWQHGVKPLVKEIVLKGETTTSALANGFLTGDIDGAYTMIEEANTFRLLESSSAVKVYFGPSDAMSGFVVGTLHGLLGNVKVRQALSLAINRNSIVKAVFGGAAQVPRWFTNPTMFAYAKSTFEHAYDTAPTLRQTIAQAKKLLKEAGAVGKTITIGMSDQIAEFSALADAVKLAGQAIGLNVVEKAFSAENYGELFTTPKLRKGLAGWFTLNYGTYSAPTAMLSTIELPGASENYDTFNTPQITSLLDSARSTLNPTARAELNIKAEQLTMKELPWIPFVEPYTTLVLNSSLTGAFASFSYMWSPWANDLGGKG
jgi:peptide/nickel transport system substrate-binding protein